MCSGRIARRFSHHKVQRNIPGIWDDLIDALAIKRESNQSWFAPHRRVLQKRERRIKISAAHADATALSVKCDERYQDDIQMVCFGRSSKPGGGLSNAHGVSPQT